MDFSDFLAHTILVARKRCGYTQSEVATSLSISVRWYQRIEKGESVPGTLLFIRLLFLLDIDIDVFREYFEGRYSSNRRP